MYYNDQEAGFVLSLGAVFLLLCFFLTQACLKSTCYLEVDFVVIYKSSCCDDSEFD